ncbi:hypothetical protein EDB89DRAFT_386596 [Lactarius sanguifluus]|nr:hypothetical protein EDB89DRAFT_386596 [Lactarius sanguifluus]
MLAPRFAPRSPGGWQVHWVIRNVWFGDSCGAILITSDRSNTFRPCCTLRARNLIFIAMARRRSDTHELRGLTEAKSMLILPAARLYAALNYLVDNPGVTPPAMLERRLVIRDWSVTSPGNTCRAKRRLTAFTQCLRSLIKGGSARRVKAGPQSSKTSHLGPSRRVAQIWRRGIQTSPLFSILPICRRSWIEFQRYSIGGRQMRSRVKVSDCVSSQ